jgi:hypothetical protein
MMEMTRTGQALKPESPRSSSLHDQLYELDARAQAADA